MSSSQPIRILNRDSDEVNPDDLTLHPENPRRGDVASLIRSFRLNGFYGKVAVDITTGYVVVGNHRVKAARQLGMEVIPVDFIECDDEDHALDILLVDNRLSDQSTYNNELLVNLLERRVSEDRSLEGAGYSEPLLRALRQEVEDVEPPEAFPSYDDDIDVDYCCPKCGYEWSGSAS